MSATTTTNWTNTGTCPFCGDQLADPGAGFVDHIGENPNCQSSFDVWRENVAGDVAGEWSG